MRSSALRVLVLGFWACWLTVVAASNATNALRAAHLLGTGFPFASSNFELVATTTAIYHTPRAAVWLLFLGVVAWEALAAAFFWQALLGSRWRRAGALAAEGAAPVAPFATAMALFAAFMLADELLIAYPLEATHMRVFIALGVSWLVVSRRAG